MHTQFKDAGGKGGRADRSHAYVDNIALSDEVNGTAGEREYSGEEFRSEDREEDDDNGDDEEVNHPGEASVGRKLWTFLTT